MIFTQITAAVVVLNTILDVPDSFCPIFAGGAVAGESLVSEPDSFNMGAYAVWRSLERDGLAVSGGKPVIDGSDVYGVSYKMMPAPEVL